MRGFFAVVALAGISGCATNVPLDEAERSRIRVVAPAAARFAPDVEFKLPPGKIEGAVSGGAGTAIEAGRVCVFLVFTGPGLFTCMAAMGAGAAFGAAATPSNEEIEPSVVRARGQLGARDVQQLLAQRFAERVARLTPLKIDPSASKHGPQSPTDAPSCAGVVAGQGTLVAEVAVELVGATLETFELIGADYASRPLRIWLSARLRLVRPSDGTTVMTRYYRVTRLGRRMQEYVDDGTRFLPVIAGAVDEVATLMVDDAFLLQPEAVSTDGAVAPAVTPLQPLPSRPCFARAPVLELDCWAANRVPTLTPAVRWKPFPETGHLETSPSLRAVRNLVYDLWIFGGRRSRRGRSHNDRPHA